MARMVRKQIYMDVEQERILKSRAKKLRKTEAELVREGINTVLNRAYLFKDSAAWGREMKFLQSLMKKGPAKGKSQWSREDLHDR
ncbi:MAG: hypothetical protein HY758_11185 [Nitrospirae bacterium]|nr:hypothetical protein [Nitrospirota bacterium]